MKLRLETNFYRSESAYEAQGRGGPTAPSQRIAANIDWPFGREPVVAEWLHFAGASLKVETVDWFAKEGVCHVGLSDAVGQHDQRYLHEAGFRSETT